jgi:hypothetical protein
MSTFDTKAKGINGLTDKSQLQTMKLNDGKIVLARYSNGKKGLIPMIIKDELKAEEVSLRCIELGMLSLLTQCTKTYKGYMIQIIKSDNNDKSN